MPEKPTDNEKGSTACKRREQSAISKLQTLRLFERKIKQHPYRGKSKKYLRTELAIIPLEATMSQADPRTEPIISFIGVSDLLDEETTAFPTSKKQRSY